MEVDGRTILLRIMNTILLGTPGKAKPINTQTGKYKGVAKDVLPMDGDMCNTLFIT